MTAIAVAHQDELSARWVLSMVIETGHTATYSGTDIFAAVVSGSELVLWWTQLADGGPPSWDVAIAERWLGLGKKLTVLTNFSPEQYTTSLESSAHKKMLTEGRPGLSIVSTQFLDSYLSSLST